MARGRVRTIRGDEVSLWLGVLLGAAFDPTSHTLNLARSAELLNAQAKAGGVTDHVRVSARDGLGQLLSLAGDFVTYPEDYRTSRQAELLLIWANRWLQPEDWNRLQAKVRKRRELINKERTK